MNRELEDYAINRIFTDEILDKSSLTTIEQKVIDLLIEGWDIEDISTICNKSKATIYRIKKKAVEKLKEAYLSTGEEPLEVVDTDMEALRFRNNHATYEMIGEIYDISLQSAYERVRNARKKLGQPELDDYRNSKYTKVVRIRPAKYCAICGKHLRTPAYDLCYKCYTEHGIDTPWVQALIHLGHREYRRDTLDREHTFMDVDIDQNGDKLPTRTEDR